MWARVGFSSTEREMGNWWLISRYSGPAHAVYFGTYEIVKEMAGGNVDDGHHPLAAGMSFLSFFFGLKVK